MTYIKTFIYRIFPPASEEQFTCTSEFFISVPDRFFSCNPPIFLQFFPGTQTSTLSYPIKFVNFDNLKLSNLLKTYWLYFKTFINTFQSISSIISCKLQVMLQIWYRVLLKANYYTIFLHNFFFKDITLILNNKRNREKKNN